MIERGGIRFGLFGVLGKEAQIYTSGGAVTFADPIETAKEMVKVLRETEKVDVVIALSHGGVTKDKDGRYTGGEDVELPRAVPGIDVVIGGHSHTELREAIIVNDRTPVVQTGKEGREPRRAGDLAGRRHAEGRVLPALSRSTTPLLGDRAIAGEIDTLKKSVTGAVFASRGYSIDQPLAIAPRDLPNTFTDIGAGTLLANLVHRRLQRGDEGRRRIHRQRNDARRPEAWEVRRADGLRRVCRGAARLRCDRPARPAAPS